MRRFIALMLTVLTGVSALVYEVAWQKYLASLLGSHSEATAAVLGIFLGGLSLGYWLFGTVTRRVMARAAARGRSARLLMLYGIVEALIGIYALVFPWLFQFARAISLGIGHSAGGFGFLFDVALTALLIGPPTVLMGGTIPVLTQALSRGLEDATRVHAFIYAFNTAGAFIGAFSAGFFLIPWLGLGNAVRAMGYVNLSAGAMFVLLGLGTQAVVVVAGASEERNPRISGMWLYCSVACLVGFASMALQTVLIRIGRLSLGSSEFTFSAIVAVFVLCIALGSFAVSALPRVGLGQIVGALWVLAALLVLLYTQLPDAPYWAHVLRSVFRSEDAAFYPYYLSVFMITVVLLSIPIGLSGATLPLIFSRLRREVGLLGTAAGRLYAWNTVGSLLGALLGGYLLLMWLDLHDVFRIAIASVLVAAGLVTAHGLGPGRRWIAATIVVPLALGLLALPEWDPNRLASSLFRMREPTRATHAGPDKFFRGRGHVFNSVFYDDDPTTSVSVRTIKIPGRPPDMDILTNGKSDSAAGSDYQTLAMMGLLPAVFADRARSAFVIGYGTGVSAGELAELRSMERVVVAEISRGVVAAAPLFENLNRHALARPEVEIVVGDAYRALIHSEERFDIIASEPSNPWTTGVEMLFSQEFLQAARDRLTPGGVYAQWFHLYETDEEVVSLVFRTYASVFDHVAVWFSQRSDLILLGFASPEHALDLGRIARRVNRPDIRAGLQRAGIGGVAELLAHELLPLDVVNIAPLGNEVHTLFHPVLSYRAARSFYRGNTAELPSTIAMEPARIGAQNSLLRRLADQNGGTLPEESRARAIAELCRHRPDPCATLMAQWMHEQPVNAVREDWLIRLRQAGIAEEALEPSRLTALVHLFDGDGAPDQESVSPESAKQVTSLFFKHYHHAAPFPRSVLSDIWRRCTSDGGRRPGCAKALQSAEGDLGPLLD